MSSLLLALQFLTIIPLRVSSYTDEKKVRSLFYFPIVGLFLGSLLYIANSFFLAINLPGISINILLILLLIVLTGGMHLDGLCDSADAFLSHKPKDEMLAIMRDPHAGAMGIIAIVSCLLLKFSLLCAITFQDRPIALLLACMLSRWVVVAQMAQFPYARAEGKAKTYMQGINKRILVLTTMVAVSFAFLICQFNGVIVLLIAWICAYIGGKFSSKKIGGITGDTLGATIELTEIGVFASVCLLERIF